MAIVKGEMKNGYLEVNRAVRFTNAYMSKAGPWGKTLFVDGVNGSDTLNSGYAPDSAFKTIQAAVTKAGRGDTIFVRPLGYTAGTGFDRYNEQVVVPYATNDLSIIGVTNTINAEFGVRHKYTSAGQPLDIWAPGCHVENIGYFAEGATYSVLLTNNGATLTKMGSNGSTFYNCVFKGSPFKVLSGGTGVSLERCRFTPAYDGTVCSLDISCSANPGRQFTLKNSEFLDAIGVAVVDPFIKVAAPCTELLVSGVNFPMQPSGGVYINTAGANYGLISNCFFNHDDLDTDAAIVLGTGVLAVACYDAAGLATAA